jgi:hypothetical protein
VGVAALGRVCRMMILRWFKLGFWVGLDISGTSYLK